MNRLLASSLTATVIAALGCFVPPAAAGGSDLVKMARSGVDGEVLRAYIQASPDTFRLSAGDIDTLKDLGVPPGTIAEALRHGHPSDSAASNTATRPSEAGSTNAAAPTGTGRDISFFYQELCTYGTWLEIDGQWCWQPNAATVSPDWAPYCSQGHWVYTDWGWYWASDYSWGWAPFHYGRWFRNQTHGWCWLPGSEWAPAWVAWRHDGEYCGWAPLPPRSRIDQGGVFYNDSPVDAGTEFNLTAQDYTFLPASHFGDPHPWADIVSRDRADEVYGRTAYDRNAWSFERGHLFDRGPAVEEIARAGNREIIPVTIVHDEPKPGQAIPRATVDNDRMLVFKPAIAPVAPQSPVEVKSRLDRQHAEEQARRPLVEPTPERDIAREVLQQDATPSDADRVSAERQRAARMQADLMRERFEEQENFRDLHAEHAQRHLTGIEHWILPTHYYLPGSEPWRSRPANTPTHQRATPQPDRNRQQSSGGPTGNGDRHQDRPSGNRHADSSHGADRHPGDRGR